MLVFSSFQTMNLRFQEAKALLILTCLTLPLLSVESTQPPFACDSANPLTKSLTFCQTGLPIRERVKDLISRLAVDEKISRLVNSAPAIPRLGIPPYEWWSEALHGVSGYGYGVSFLGRIRSVTMFPQVILFAATFDSHLWYRIGQAVGKEARAMYNVGQVKGMNFWTPNVNIFRDPRWGRGQETPGEDPLVAGNYAVAFVRGFQGDSYEGGMLQNEGLLQASACCKHFTAYDMDNWNGITRFGFNAQVTQQDLADTYEPPFRSCVEQGKVSGIMCAYNSVNGVPSCADHDLLTTTLRGQWGFNGYITSDCDSVSTIFTNHKYTNSPEDAVADVLKAGMDLNCGSYLKTYTKSAIQQKKLVESDVDRALSNIFEVQMRLGLFNGNPNKQAYGDIGPDQVCSQEHQQLALQAALNGIVLLKNTNKLLPLSKSKTSSLAVIGPNAHNAYALRGDYDGPPCRNLEIDKALRAYVPNTMYNKGCDFANCTAARRPSATRIAEQADYVILVMGLDQSLETEDRDRMDLMLPGKQEDVIRAVASVSKRPVILVVVSGGPVDISFAKNDPKIGSILWAGYPGQAGGIALAQIIFGEHNPGGKLPMTWYPKDFVNVPMTDMRMRPDPSSGYPGRTYRFYQGPKVFEFGYGLHYTTYTYEFISSTPNAILFNQIAASTRDTGSSSNSKKQLFVSEIETSVCEGLKFTAFVRVENKGDMDGNHPVLLFIRNARPNKGNPIKQLVGFKSVSLNAGEGAEIEFVLNPCEHLSTANEDGLMLIEEGYRYLVVEDKEYLINIVL